MAERGTILRRLVSEVPMPAMTGHMSLSSISGIQADTECAETLLALAASWNGVVDIKPMPSSSNDEYTEGREKIKDDEEIAKEKEEYEYRQDLLRRVKLDHNYYWSGPVDHRPPVAKARKISESEWKCTDVVVNKHEYLDSDTLSSPEHSGDSGVSDLSPDMPTHTSRIKRGNKDTHNNLQLLLQCIVESEKNERWQDDDDDGVAPHDDGVEPHDEGADSDSNMYNDYSFRDSFGADESGFSYQSYVCQKCSRQFNKKRYLTKHMRRMHPELTNVKHHYAVCPSCGLEQARRNFSKNYVVCMACMKKSRNKTNDSDIAACQHCGVRLRRHMLVKHLAQEHRVDKLMSGDVDIMDTRAFICSLCNLTLKTSQVNQHFLDEHLCQDVDKGLHLDCQLCGMELADTKLSTHLTTQHCRKVENVDVSPKGLSTAAASQVNLSSSSCKTNAENRDDLQFGEDRNLFCPGSSRTSTSPNKAGLSSVSPSKDIRVNRHFIVKKADASVGHDMEGKQSLHHSINTTSSVPNKNALLIQPLSY